jgi:hypothetical protein
MRVITVPNARYNATNRSNVRMEGCCKQYVALEMVHYQIHYGISKM